MSSSPQPRLRDSLLRDIDATRLWDVVVIGGGATGLGTAVEAASRGYRILLLERGDFAEGTSSRSTKLVHGGVRYLEQMNLRLVLDALRERGYMLRNAPHLVHKLDFVIPAYSYASLPYYGLGLKLYERLSGKLSFGPTELLSRADTLARLPTLESQLLRGGILYRDGQFDDARYAIALMRTLEDLGGTALNYAEVTGLLKRDGKIEGLQFTDCETGDTRDVLARVVINATGAFTDTLLRMDDPSETPPLAISQGSHFVLSPDLLPSASALMIPKTSDGRVLFAIPWHAHLLVGTTDVPVNDSASEPHASPSETGFLTSHIRKYLGRSLQPADVLSMWSGLRPLVRSTANAATAKLSRDHRITLSPSGLVTVIGGKWTTYRKMGEDTLDRAIEIGSLPHAPSRTADLKLHGWQPSPQPGTEEPEVLYGSDLDHLRALSKEHPDWNDLLHPQLPYRKRDVIWAARHEHARTVADVLARRTRALFLNARATLDIADVVSRLLAVELGTDEAARLRDLERFRTIASGYIFAG
ncbi:MAG TPA: glycerol-3-phosphate dehydrogenase/oxidase [Acidobacteriaceae bacterium]|jgi:glycerol-3-phosphate dehydrogenase|nr:glycerol-3-phosphate dehydrogenase/oxidase [Acidobacteriaceae bacterium]